MEIKNKILIGVVLVGCLALAVLYGVGRIFLNKEETNNKKNAYVNNLDKNNDGIPDSDDFQVENGIIKKNGKVIYDPNEEYLFPYDSSIDIQIPSKNEFDLEELESYIKVLRHEIGSSSYQEFTKDNIDNLMLMLSMSYYPRTNKETIKKIAKLYFDIDDYELPIGTYHTKSLGNIDVIRVNDYYISHTEKDRKLYPPYFKYITHKLDGNDLVVEYEQVDYMDAYEGDNRISKKYGLLRMYLEFKDSRLIVKKTEYTPYEEYKNSNIVINKDRYDYLEISSDGSILTNDTKEKMFDVTKEYLDNPLIPIKDMKLDDAVEIAEYSKYFDWIYKEETVEIIDDKTISAVVALASGLNEPKKEDVVQEVAKRYFNIENYELPTGTYELKNYGKFTVAKSNGYYVRSDIKEKVQNSKISYINNLESVDDLHIVLTLEEAPETGCYSPVDRKEECISGYYKIYLYHFADLISVEKIEYQKNDKYKQ
ncbi:MAG: hypothetical protein K2J20_06130 [Bacilli bacterium]|nr:hypothetical protein [Bacilli bacterium]